jgi:DNA-binding LacI/PurR family transcriptional regulator
MRGFGVRIHRPRLASATKEAVQYLLDNGHKKIACIKGPPDWTPTRFRYLGWFKGLTENGLPLGPCYEGDWSPQSGYDITRSLIKNHLNDFTAIVVQNDLMAFGVLRALQESGIRVPHEVSVIGAQLRLAWPQSTIEQGL